VTYDRLRPRRPGADHAAADHNNAFGLHRLRHEFYPEALPEFEQRSEARVRGTQGANGRARSSRMGTRAGFLDIEEAYDEHAGACGIGQARWHEFCRYFSIGCFVTTMFTCSGWAGGFRCGTSRTGAMV
jgi:hypothetical protein